MSFVVNKKESGEYFTKFIDTNTGRECYSFEPKFEKFIHNNYEDKRNVIDYMKRRDEFYTPSTRLSVRKIDVNQKLVLTPHVASDKNPKRHPVTVELQEKHLRYRRPIEAIFPHYKVKKVDSGSDTVCDGSHEIYRESFQTAFFKQIEKEYKASLFKQVEKEHKASLLKNACTEKPKDVRPQISKKESGKLQKGSSSQLTLSMPNIYRHYASYRDLRALENPSQPQIASNSGSSTSTSTSQSSTSQKWTHQTLAALAGKVGNGTVTRETFREAFQEFIRDA